MCGRPAWRRVVVAVLLAARTAARAGAPDAAAPMQPGGAHLPPAAVAALDALVRAERPAGGWSFHAAPSRRAWPSTFTLQWAERIGGLLGGAHWDLVVVRSRGTPDAGLLLLHGWRATGRTDWLDAARRAGDLLVATQLADGGWTAEIPVNDGAAPSWFEWIDVGAAVDDDVTPGAIGFLLALGDATADPRYAAAATRAVDALLAAQLPSGAWPLSIRPAWRRRLRPRYTDLAAVNDGATPATIRTLLLAAERLHRPDARAAAEHGGRWLASVREPPPRAGWAQQYDAGGRPAAGRPFEPPALASWETRLAIEALLDLARVTGDARWCAAVPAAVAWLAAAAIAPGCWARLYDRATGTPLLVSDRGRLVQRPDDAHRPYTWRGTFGIPELFAQLGLDAAGRPAPDVRPAAVRPLDGDPGRCADAHAPPHVPGARELITRAGYELGALRPASPSPCRAALLAARR